LNLTGRIQFTNYIYFTENEFDPERTKHNKSLYIIVKYKDCIVVKVLIDNGSALNVLPRRVLNQMLVNASHVKPNTIIARAYDKTPRPII
jgi:hypothetical protein